MAASDTPESRSSVSDGYAVGSVTSPKAPVVATRPIQRTRDPLPEERSMTACDTPESRLTKSAG